MISLLPFISFFSGIASVVSPCILPVIPVLFGFTLKKRRNIELVAFTLGLFFIFTIVIFITSFFTVIFYDYIIYIRIIAGLILVTVGIVFIVNRTATIAIGSPENSEGIVGSFMLGLLTSVAWAPCYSGYLISLLSVLMTQSNIIYNSLNIVLYCIGFAAAIWIISIILKKIDLGKFIKSSVYLRRVSGILFLIGSIYMILTAMGIVII